ncbi:MAG TPA: hypothetical protein VK454_13795, partial [Myxococcaceae bacterium]|nr:hypothetical protein [Myxococcaceae bacterium]
QTMDLSQKLDELGATRSSLTDQLKDKEAALAALNQRHDALVNELRAALKSSKSKSALQKHVGQALAHDASAAADATGAATTGRPRHTRK